MDSDTGGHCYDSILSPTRCRKRERQGLVDCCFALLAQYCITPPKRRTEFPGARRRCRRTGRFGVCRGRNSRNTTSTRRNGKKREPSAHARAIYTRRRARRRGAGDGLKGNRVDRVLRHPKDGGRVSNVRRPKRNNAPESDYTHGEPNRKENRRYTGSGARGRTWLEPRTQVYVPPQTRQRPNLMQSISVSWVWPHITGVRAHAKPRARHRSIVLTIVPSLRLNTQTLST